MAEIPIDSVRFGHHIIIVDDDDLELVSDYSWSLHGRPHYTLYAKAYKRGTGRSGGKIMVMHRVIMGDACEGKDVDHINGNGLDNRRCNLRVVEHRLNQRNLKTRRRPKSGYKGVEEQTRKPGTFSARIVVDGKRFCLGTRNSAVEAARLYDDAARKLHGSFAALNFPSEGEVAAVVHPPDHIEYPRQSI